MTGTVYADTDDMKHPFQPINLPRRNPSASKESYRVYSDAVNFKLVEAENAAAALKASGLTDARRIERYAPTLQTVLDSQIFSEVAATPPPAAAAAAAAPEAVQAKPAENAAPLSSDDVNKLLQEAPPSPLGASA